VARIGGRRSQPWIKQEGGRIDRRGDGKPKSRIADHPTPPRRTVEWGVVAERRETFIVGNGINKNPELRDYVRLKRRRVVRVDPAEQAEAALEL
jgi:hypothetical protein